MPERQTPVKIPPSLCRCAAFAALLLWRADGSQPVHREDPDYLITALPGGPHEEPPITANDYLLERLRDIKLL